VNIYDTAEIIGEFNRFLVDFLSRQKGRRATIKIARVFRLRSFYAGHVYALISSSIPPVALDRLGRRWVLVHMGRRYYGRDGKTYRNIIVYQRVDGDGGEA